MVLKKVKVDRNSFKNENAYQKYMKKLANKHDVVVELKSGGVDYWFSEKAMATATQNAQEQGKTVDEILKEQYAHLNPSITAEKI